MLREHVSSGSPFNKPVEFSRALRDGNTIASSQTRLEGGFVWKGKKTVAVLQVVHAPGRKEEISNAQEWHQTIYSQNDLVGQEENYGGNIDAKM